MEDNLKRCSKCKVEKKRECFNKDNRTKDGLNCYCKQCRIILNKQSIERRKKRKKQIVISKICSRCKKEKLASEFDKMSRNRDGLKEHCKSCRSTEFIENYYKNHERSKKKSRENGLKHYYKNKEKILRKKREWRKANPGKGKNYNSWHSRNPEESKKKHRAWLKEHKEATIRYTSKRRMNIKKATIIEFTGDQLNQRMSVFGNKCAYCGGIFQHIDHVIPLSRGGYHCLANLRPACAHCNLSKGRKKLSEWKPEIYS